MEFAVKESKLATVVWIIAGLLIGFVIPTAIAYVNGWLDPIFSR